MWCLTSFNKTVGKLWLLTVSVGDPAAKRQLPFGSVGQCRILVSVDVESAPEQDSQMKLRRLL